MDAKASPRFHSLLRQLASCVPNILLADREWEMDSAGHNGTRAWLQCMSQLVDTGKRWEYVILLQVINIVLRWINRTCHSVLWWILHSNLIDINSRTTTSHSGPMPS